MKSLLQIARRRRTSRIFTANEFNIIKNLLTSVTLVLKSHDETHSIHSDAPKIHLAIGEVRVSSKYIWPIPLNHPSQWIYQSRIQSNVLLISMPRLYCHLVKLSSIYIFFTSDNFLVLYERILKIWINCLIQSSKRVALTSCLSSWLSGQKNRSHAVLTTSSWVSICQSQ